MELYRTDPVLWYSDRAFRYGHTWFDSRQIDAFRSGKRIPPPMVLDFPDAVNVLRYDADTSLPPNTAQLSLFRSATPSTPRKIGSSSTSRNSITQPLSAARKTAPSAAQSSPAPRIIVPPATQPSSATTTLSRHRGDAADTKRGKKPERLLIPSEGEDEQEFDPGKKTSRTKNKSRASTTRGTPFPLT